MMMMKVVFSGNIYIYKLERDKVRYVLEYLRKVIRSVRTAQLPYVLAVAGVVCKPWTRLRFFSSPSRRYV